MRNIYIYIVIMTNDDDDDNNNIDFGTGWLCVYLPTYEV